MSDTVATRSNVPCLHFCLAAAHRLSLSLFFFGVIKTYDTGVPEGETNIQTFSLKIAFLLDLCAGEPVNCSENGFAF